MHNPSYDKKDDVALWNLVIMGDMKALSLLYKKHYELLLNFGLKYTQDEEFVKDCIQDVFVKICTSKKLSHTDYVRSYFLTSVKNAILDKMVSMKETEAIESHFFEFSIEDSYIETLFEKNDEDILLGKKLAAAYNRLSENQRMGIYLRFVKGLSYKEIANIMNVNPQSSMNLVSRALISLRSIMTRDEMMLLIFMLTVFVRTPKYLN